MENSTGEKSRVRCVIKARAPRGTDRSPEYNEHFCYKLGFLANQKALSMTTPFVASWYVFDWSMVASAQP